ncbi:MAG: hypothetical protein C0510_00585 [Erythrobacter sp.]|nr:hypothetical protein [Erythrobacter sp.]
METAMLLVETTTKHPLVARRRQAARGRVRTARFVARSATWNTWNTVMRKNFRPHNDAPA